MSQTIDGGYVIAGQSSSSDGDVSGNQGDSDLWIVKTDGSGNIQWEQNYGGSGAEDVAGIVQTPNGNYVVTGYSTSIDGDVGGNNGNRDFWLIKLNQTGVIQWEKNYGGSMVDQPNDIHFTTDGSYILAGISNSSDGDVEGNYGAFDFWVIKTQPDPLSIEDVLVNQISIYPNPASNSIQIQTTNGIEQIELYDVLGKKIITKSFTDKNSQIETIDVSQLSSGNYILKVYSNRQIDSFKIIKE